MPVDDFTVLLLFSCSAVLSTITEFNLQQRRRVRELPRDDSLQWGCVARASLVGPASHPELRLPLAGGAVVSLCVSAHHADLWFLKHGFWLWTCSVVFYKITCLMTKLSQ